MNMNEAYNKRFNAIKNGKPYTFDYKKAVFGTTDSEKIVNLIKREFDRKNQSTRHKIPFGISEEEQIEGFFGKKE